LLVSHSYTPKKKTFPFILHEILSDPESQNIITWMPHGCSWRVLDKEKLAKVICPKYFSHSKFEHFTRSVNGWGFKVRTHRAKCGTNAAREGH
ncbi:hypothetical protein ACHAXS_008259, partial [Conticribra weissflogii]